MHKFRFFFFSFFHCPEDSDHEQFELHLYAVKVALEDHLLIPLDKKERHNIPSKLLKIQRCQNSIDSILQLSLDNPLTVEVRYGFVCTSFFYILVDRTKVIYNLCMILVYIIIHEPYHWLSLSLYGILRCLWHSVRVLQLFVEHLVMRNEDLANYARRLYLVNFSV